MVLGQSAATAACQAIDADTDVQDIDMARLRERLLADKQVLSWDEPPRADAVDHAKLPGIVADDTQTEREGEWTESSAIGGFIGVGYLHDGNADKGHKSLKFKLLVNKAGRYEARLAYTPNPNRATNLRVLIEAASTESKVTINERQAPAIDGHFASLGKFELKAGESVTITIPNRDTDGYVVVDAVQLAPIE
jgi:hypothetical protein